MSESMRGAAFAGGPAVETAVESDYRLREVEARLDRRLSVVESRGGRSGMVAGLLGMGLVFTLAALAFVLTTVVPRDGAWAVNSVTAEEIVLRDAEGIERGRLATDSDGQTQLTLSDHDGRERIRLTVLPDGSPGVTISDPEARRRAVLGYLPDGTTNLVFADEDGISRAVVGLEADGSTQALFSDHSGAVRTMVGVGADGEPSVSTFEARSAGGTQ